MIPGDPVAEKRRTGGRKTAAIVAGALVLMMAGAIAYLSVVTIDLTPHLPRIIEAVEQRVAGKMEVEGLTVKFLPSPDIRINGIESRMEGKQIFGARFVHLRVSLLPLVIGHVNIKEIELEEAAVYIERDADGLVNLNEFIRVSREKRKKRRKLFSFSFKLMNITGTHVEISDRKPGEPVDFDITDIKGIIRATAEGVALEANAHLAPDTSLSFSGKVTSAGAEGSGSLKSLRLERFGPYLREKSPGAALTGTLDLDFVYTGTKVKEFKGTLRYDSLSLSMPELLAEKLSSQNGTAQVSLLPETADGPELTVSGINLDLGSFALSGLFRLGKEQGEFSYTLELSATPVPFKELMALPSPEYAGRISYVKPLGGSVTIDKLSITRPLVKTAESRQERFKGVELAASLNALSLDYTGLKKPVEEVSASVSLKDEVLKVSGMTGRYGKERLTGLDAAITGLSLPEDASYELSAQAVLDVNETLRIVSGLIKDGGAAGLVLSRSEAQGEMRVKGGARGTLKGGLSAAAYSATAEITGGSFSYRGLPLKAKSINAKAEFNEKSIKQISLSATDGSSEMELSASVRDYREREPRMDIALRGKAAGATLRSLVQGSTFEKETGFEGDILYDIKVNGTPSEAAAKIKLDAGAAYIQYKKILDKPPGVKLALDLSASKKGKTIDIKTAGLSFSKASSMSVAGSFATNLSSYDITVGAARLILSDMAMLSGYLDKGFNSAGLVSFTLNTAKKPGEAPASYKGEVQVANGRFQSTGLPKPVDDIDAHASFTGNSASLTLDNLSIGRTRASARVDVTDIARRTVNFEVNSTALYSDDLLLKKKKEDGKEPEKKAPEKKPGPSVAEPGPSLNGHGTVRVAKGELYGQPFKDFQAELAIEEHVARAEPVTMEIDNGRLTGNFAYHMSPLSKKTFDSRFKLTGIDLDTMLRGFGAKKEYLTGRLNATVELSGARGVKPFSAGLAGTASLRAEGGRMWKLPVLADIFNIVNILTLDELLQKGLPYKEIYADFDMAGGVANTKNITMNSDSMRMSAAGELNFPAGSMDMVLGIHPFVTIDKIISNIPFAGWLITGKEESTVSMYFSIKGPFKDRTVRPMPIEGIAKGVLGILQRVLEAPVDILKGEIPGEEEKKKLKPREAQ